MPQDAPSASPLPPPLADDPQRVWQGVARDALASRKNEATQAEITRMGKTLARLSGAALVVMGQRADQAAGPGALPPASFDDTLKQLAHG
ncbi:MAG: hypothetical protein JWP29_2747 [Rhodoferax sp.]|nr:hypothetical protein [Rhodoferax sp.]